MGQQYLIAGWSTLSYRRRPRGTGNTTSISLIFLHHFLEKLLRFKESYFRTFLSPSPQNTHLPPSSSVSDQDNEIIARKSVRGPATKDRRF